MQSRPLSSGVKLEISEWEIKQLLEALRLLEWDRSRRPTAGGIPVPDAVDLILLARRSVIVGHSCEKCAEGRRDSFPNFEKTLPLIKEMAVPGSGNYTGGLSNFRVEYWNSKVKSKNRLNIFYLIHTLLYWSDPNKESEKVPICDTVSEWPKEAIQAVVEAPELLQQYHAAASDDPLKSSESDFYVEIPKFDQRRGRPLKAPRFDVMILLLHRHLDRARMRNPRQSVEELIMQGFPGRFDGTEIKHILDRATPAIKQECKKFESRFGTLSIERWRKALEREYPNLEWNIMAGFFERIVQSDPELIRMGGFDLKAITLNILDLDERVCNSSKEMAQKWGRPLERCLSAREVETMSQEERNERKTLGDRVGAERQKLIEEFYECVARGEQRLRKIPSEEKATANLLRCKNCGEPFDFERQNDSPACVNCGVVAGFASGWTGFSPSP